MSKTSQDVTKAIRNMARAYSYAVEGETIAFYAEVLLGRLTPDEAVEGIGRWVANETRWPAPGSIIKLIKPTAAPRDLGAILAQDLLGLIGRHGWSWEPRYDGYASTDDAITAMLGDTAASVVRRCGGWQNFCREWGGEQGDGTARAQLRDLCAAAVSAPAGGFALPSHKSGDAIGDFISQRHLAAKNEMAQLVKETIDAIEVKKP